MGERIDKEFNEENRQKKNIAKNAKKKVTHSGCKLPSDYLTKKDFKKLNGEIKIMKMFEPVSYYAFKLWPLDLQKEYLINLVEGFGVGLYKVAEMMGVSGDSFKSYLRSKSMRDIFPRKSSQSKFMEQKWKSFCDGIPYSDYQVSETEENNQDETTNSVNSMSDNLSVDSYYLLYAYSNSEIKTAPMEFVTLSLTIKNVNSWEDLYEFLRKYPLPKNNRVSISMEECVI